MQLCLSKAECSQMKIWMHLSEKTARNQEQVNYLKVLRNHDLFPATIDNLQLPAMFKDKSMKNSTIFIKRYVLKKMIRFVNGEIAKLKKKLSLSVDDIFRQFDISKACKLCSAIEEAYQRSKQFHKDRLAKKMKFMEKKKKKKSREDEVLAPEDNELVTDLTKSLNREELELLSKGPKFALSTEIDEIDIKANFCVLANQLRWTQFHKEKKTDRVCDGGPALIPKYPLTENIYEPPTTYNELELKLKLCFARIQELVLKIKKQKPVDNLTSEEKRTLKALKSKQLTYLPSDKGSEFCVIETSEYDEAALNHLNNRAIYTPVRTMTAKTIEAKINQTWRRISEQSRIPAHVVKSFVSTNTDLPHFYHLIKTHKDGPTTQIRPIVSNRKGPSRKLSWLLSRILRPLLDSLPFNLENSLELLNDINDMPSNKKSQFNYPFSLDVKALYTSVPPKDAIQIAKEKFEEEMKNKLPFQGDQVSEILTVILENTYFRFKENIFKQTTGLPMGNSVSPILAILYMDRIERQVVANFHQIGLYKRYVDDILIITNNRETAEEIFNKFNSEDPNIKFEIEHPDKNNSLALLDFRVTLSEGESEFCFYKKLAKKNTFPHIKSAIPWECKINSVKNEVKRIEERCSSEEDKARHINTFFRQLHTRGYQKSVENKAKQQKKATRNSANEKFCYFEFPFVSDAAHHAVRRIFKAADLPVRVYSRNRNLRSVLNKRTIYESCTIKNCPLNNYLCLKKNCVYRMTCNKCKQQYIGSTKRPLHQRVKEHYQNFTSSVYQHRSKCQSDFAVEIVARDFCTSRLRVKEAIWIKNASPTINSKSERDELLHLIF